jgi:hypothetical protein
VVIGHESVGPALGVTENANFKVGDLVADIALEAWLPTRPLRAVKCFRKWERSISSTHIGHVVRIQFRQYNVRS